MSQIKIHPLEQFYVHKIVSFNLFGIDLSITNSAIVMFFGVFFVGFIATVAFLLRNKVIPNRFLSLLEQSVLFVENIVVGKVSKSSPLYRAIFVFIYSIFLLTLILNILGLFPFSFATTGHISVTFALALVVFVFTVLISIAKHGIFFFKIFVPHGTPLWMVPLIFVLEVFSYLAKPISLSVRLAANMIAGHVMLEVIGGFAAVMGLFSFLPLGFLVAINLFEIFVACLQAYVFALLSTIYISEALHH